MKKLITITTIVVMMSPVLADWDPIWNSDGTSIINHKMHYPQLPDLSSTGVDVLTFYDDTGSVAGEGFGKILADDWKCSQSGPVSDIHIWGSWLFDILPAGLGGVADPSNVMFKLSIHADIPEDATNPLGYSHPGEELWQDVFSPGDPRVKTRLYANNLSEQFYDPNMDEIIGFDTEAYQYNFFLDPLDPNIFHQEEGTIYWLDVQAWVDPGNSDNQAVFGWKSTRNVWNDDAVFGDNTIFGQSDPPNALFWQEMYHPLIPDESLNLAFVITPEPATISLLVIGGIGVLARRRKR